MNDINSLLIEGRAEAVEIGKKSATFWLRNERKGKTLTIQIVTTPSLASSVKTGYKVRVIGFLVESFQHESDIDAIQLFAENITIL